MSLTQQFVKLFPYGLDGIIFDCDGVLIDSSRVNIGYYNLILEKLGKLPMSEANEIYVQMSSVKESLDYLTTPEEYARLPEIVEAIPYKVHALPLLTLEDGIRDILDLLPTLGLRCALHTNRAAGMYDILERFDLFDIFDPVMTSDIVKPKPDPEGIFRILDTWHAPRERILFIGDSHADYQASSNAQVPFAAYKNTLLDADIHIPSYPDLRKALKEACQIWQNKE